VENKNVIKYIYWAASAPVLATVAANFVGLKFADPRLNTIVFLMVLITPYLFVLLILVTRTPKEIILRVVFIFLLMVAQFLFSLFLFFVLADFPHGGIDPSFEPIHRLDINGHHYICYRINPGALDPFSIQIRDERRGFGFVFYRTIADGYAASDARFFQQEDGWYVEVMNDRSPHTIVKLH